MLAAMLVAVVFLQPALGPDTQSDAALHHRHARNAKRAKGKHDQRLKKKPDHILLVGLLPVRLHPCKVYVGPSTHLQRSSIHASRACSNIFIKALKNSEIS